MSDQGRRIETALRAANAHGRPGIVAFVTGGYPSPAAFPAVLQSVAAEADVVEVGIPFSDPMADGVTIQESSQVAIAGGANLASILEAIGQCDTTTPLVVMSYLNPLLQYGFERLAETAARSGVAGFIVPDLPLEESGPLRDAIARQGLALIQLVSPATPPDRARTIGAVSQGFLYAVTVNGTTGGRHTWETTVPYLASLRGTTPVPVCAGFGIRTPDDIRSLAGAADGIIVGSVLIEAINRGENPGALVAVLRDATHHMNPEGGTRS